MGEDIPADASPPDSGTPTASLPPSVPTAHDRFARHFFSDPLNFADLLRFSLPGEISRKIDLSSLELVSEAFVSKDLESRFVDLLFRMKFAGAVGYIYVLFEHKSYPDPLAFLQLAGGIVRIWERHTLGTPKDFGTLLPFVLPLVLYHGQKVWPGGRALEGLVEVPDEALRPYVLDMRVHVEDVTARSDDELSRALHAAAALLAFKHIRRADLPGILHEILRHMVAAMDRGMPRDYLDALVVYLAAKGKNMSKEQIRDTLEDLGILDYDPGTLAEEWVKEGRVEGRLEGRLEGKRASVRQFFEARWGAPTEALTGQLGRITSIETLDRLIREAACAPGPAEFLAFLASIAPREDAES